MALVVGRGRRAVRLVGGHGFRRSPVGAYQLGGFDTSSSPAQSAGTAPLAPWGAEVRVPSGTSSKRLRPPQARHKADSRLAQIFTSG